MNKLKIKKGFTLVELIIVITILVILATIAFVSFQNYTKDARDSNRLMSIKNIQNWLEWFQIKTWIYPEPENSINILAWTSTITKQWYFWESQSDIINIDKLPLDPLDWTKYIYSINNNKNKYQLLSYLEANSQLSFINETYADDLSKRNIKSFWNDLWIILNQDKTNITWTWFDILSNTWNLYSLIFTDNDITLSWSEIFTNVYNKREDLLRDESLASLDDSLVWYWNMETVCKDWSCWIWNDWKLKDLSKYSNHGTCYNWTSSWSCSIVWPKIVDWNWKSWKAMSFDWIDDYIDYWNLNFDYTNFTVFISVKTKSYNSNQEKYPIHVTNLIWKWNRNSSNQWYIWYKWPGDSNLPATHISFVYWDNWTKWPSYSLEKINMKVYNTFVGKVEPNSQNLYINWKLIDSKILTHNSVTNSFNLEIANSSYLDSYLAWDIDELRIYNRALSQEEISILYNTFN